MAHNGSLLGTCPHAVPLYPPQCHTHTPLPLNPAPYSSPQPLSSCVERVQRCARIKGVWDDSNNVWEGGGSCITEEEAAQKLLADPSGLEKLSIALSNDGKLATFSEASIVPSDIRWATARGCAHHLMTSPRQQFFSRCLTGLYAQPATLCPLVSLNARLLPLRIATIRNILAACGTACAYVHRACNQD